MKIFINYNSKNESYRAKYHKCGEKNTYAREFVIYKEYVIDRREAEEFGGFFSRLLERRNACGCPHDITDKKVQSVEISAREYKRIREKR